MRHRKAHNITGVIIEERSYVNPLVASQQERKEIRLPQLVRFGALEVLYLDLPAHPSLGRLRLDAFGLEHPPHRRLGDAYPQKPPHHIADAPAASSRCLLVRCEDDPRALIGRLLQVRMQRRLPHSERLFAALPIRLYPLDRCRVWHAQPVCHRVRAQLLIHHRTHHRLPQLLRPRRIALVRRVPRALRSLSLVLSTHLSSPSLLLAWQRARQVLTDYAIITSRSRWFAAHATRRVRNRRRDQR
jgi:hypothetical protein